MIEMLWNVFELLATIFQSFVVMHFVCVSLNSNLKNHKSRLTLVFGSIILSIIVFIINSITAYEGVLGLAYPVFIFVFSLLFLSGNILKKIFVSIGSILCVMVVGALVSNIIVNIAQSSFEELYTYQNLSRFLLIVTGQLLLVYVLNIILKITKKGDVELSPREWLLVITVFLLSFISIMIVHITLINTELLIKEIQLLTFVKVGLVLINVVCFYMVVNLSKSNKALRETVLLNQQNIFQKNYADNVKQQYDEMCQLKHDMRHSYNLIATLVKEQKYSELCDYLQQYNSEMQSTDVLINTNNEYVNAVMNTKLKSAKGKGINILCATIKDFTGIADVDLCNLLGNVLDNAIAGCENSVESNIEISISSNENKISITAKNSITDSPFDGNGELIIHKSSNKKGNYHGYGVKTIKKIAKKYHGRAEFYLEGDMFCCYIELNRK
jgi:hypothetical protein